MSAASFKLFVYGSLKRGFRNHDRFCRSAQSIVEARIIGRIYELPAGYPALVIPDGRMLAHGTAEIDSDAATQQRMQEELGRKPDIPLDGPCSAPWGWVSGELLTFEDPARHLPAMDALEGFRAGKPSDYDRVLAWASAMPSQTRVACWLYVVQDPGPGARLLPSGRWPG